MPGAATTAACTTSDGSCQPRTRFPLWERLRTLPHGVRAIDDPALFGTSLVQECARCVHAFGWVDAVLRTLAGTSIQASFAAPEVKARLATKLALWPPRLTSP